MFRSAFLIIAIIWKQEIAQCSKNDEWINCGISYNGTLSRKKYECIIGTYMDKFQKYDENLKKKAKLKQCTLFDFKYMTNNFEFFLIW